MAPCAEIGDQHGLFQPAHGSAPDLAGSGKANPSAMFLSAAMMLDWLAIKHHNTRCEMAAKVLENAVTAGFSSGSIRPIEFGGPDGVHEVQNAVIELIRIEKNRM